MLGIIEKDQPFQNNGKIKGMIDKSWVMERNIKWKISKKKWRKKRKWSKTFIPENEKVLRHKLQD